MPNIDLMLRTIAPRAGRVWHGGVTPVGAVQGISARQAHWRPAPRMHSIWELTGPTRPIVPMIGPGRPIACCSRPNTRPLPRPCAGSLNHDWIAGHPPSGNGATVTWSPGCWRTMRITRVRSSCLSDSGSGF